MSVRDQREAAFWDLWRRWGQEPRSFATALLDRYDAIDEEHNLGELPRTVAEAAEWARPAQAGDAPPDPALMVEGAPMEVVSGPMTASELAAYNARKTGKPAPAKPAAARPTTRRRTTR